MNLPTMIDIAIRPRFVGIDSLSAAEWENTYPLELPSVIKGGDQYD